MRMFFSFHQSLSPQVHGDMQHHDGTCHGNSLHVFPCRMFHFDLVCIFQDAHQLRISNWNHDSIWNESQAKSSIYQNISNNFYSIPALKQFQKLKQ